MTRTDMACYGLLASAFVLTALVVVQLQNKTVLPEAEASVALTSGPITALTTRTRDNEEALFLLHNNAQRLLIYRTDLGKNRVIIEESLDLARAFNVGQNNKPRRRGK